MRHRGPLLFALATSSVVMLAAWSARLGRRVWSPRVFAWRNFLRRPPEVETQFDCPLLIVNPRYYAFAAPGSAVGGVLRFEVSNRGARPVHSYSLRHRSPDPGGNGAHGTRPQGGLPPGRSTEGSIAAHYYHPLTLTIDFVQFADGDVWFAQDPSATVKPAGLEAGAKAAADYLLRVLEREGPQGVLASLPRIHAEVRGPFGSATGPDFGSFGFYSGVTNMEVRVEHADAEGGLEGVAAVVRAHAA